MIVIGYQGVGKSTLASKDVNVIDLESGNFWCTIDGKTYRDSSWYIPYCNIATHLSQQGYDVCVSSHKCVRDYLNCCSEHVVAVVPALELKDQWIEKLRERYNQTHKEKDLKALLNAEELYENNLLEIVYDCPNIIKINKMDYDLGLMLHRYHKYIEGDG